MSRRVRQQFLSALDVSKSTRELGKNIGDILGEYNIDATGKIDKDRRDVPYLMLQCERRRVVLRRSSRKRVRPLSREEAVEVQRSGMKNPADSVSAWEAVPLGDNGKEGKPVMRREHIADLLVNWLLKLKNDELDEYQEMRMANQQDDFGWDDQDEYGWEEESAAPAPPPRPASRPLPPRRPTPRRRPAPSVEPPTRTLAESADLGQRELAQEARETLELILKGVEVGQFSPKIAQRTVAYALSTYLDFDKPKEWLEEEREKKMKEKVQQDVLSELAEKLGGGPGGPNLLSALAAGQGIPVPGRNGRSTSPQPRTVRRPRRPSRPAPPLSSMMRNVEAASESYSEGLDEAGDFEDEDFFEPGADYSDDRFEDDNEEYTDSV